MHKSCTSQESSDSYSVRIPDVSQSSHRFPRSPATVLQQAPTSQYSAATQPVYSLLNLQSSPPSSALQQYSQNNEQQSHAAAPISGRASASNSRPTAAALKCDRFQIESRCTHTQFLYSDSAAAQSQFYDRLLAQLISAATTSHDRRTSE